MNQQSYIDWDRLVPYFLNECSQEEKAAIEEWISVYNTNDRELIARTERLWRAAWHESAPVNVNNVNMELIWNVIHKNTIGNINTRSISDSDTSTSSAQRSFSSQFSKSIGSLASRTQMAYGFTLGLAIILGIFFFKPSDIRENSNTPASSMVRSSTSSGQRANVVLPDGTMVTLNAQSQLDVPINFGSKDRIVYLRGEALFIASHRTGKPLTVVTESIYTKVLGTTFIVRRYPTDSVTLVAVQDGKVSVQSTVLTEGQEIAMNDRGKGNVYSAFSGRFTFADGILTLPWMSLGNAVKELERWAKVDIHIADPQLMKRRVQITVPDMSPTDLATFLNTVLGVRVVHDENILTILSE